MPKLPIALQMYTVRDAAARDYAGTVRQVAAIGYAGVELAGHGGLSVRALRDVLNETGLRVCGSHIGIDQLESNIGQVISGEFGNSATAASSSPICRTTGGRARTATKRRQKF